MAVDVFSRWTPRSFGLRTSKKIVLALSKCLELVLLSDLSDLTYSLSTLSRNPSMHSITIDLSWLLHPWLQHLIIDISIILSQQTDLLLVKLDS